jgi:hypothetical protein
MGRVSRTPALTQPLETGIPPPPAVEETPVSTTSPMPNELVNGNGEVLYSNPLATSIAETLADFKIHVENSASLSTRVRTHRVLVGEIGEVLTDPRILKAQQFATLGQQADALQAANRASRFAFLRPGHAEREHEIRSRLNKRLTLIAEIGTGEDPLAITRAADELGQVKDRLASRAVHLRTAQVQREVNSRPHYLTELLGPRPSSGNLRVTNLWQSTAEKIVGRRIDLGITGDSTLGLNLETDHALSRTVSSARQALGLDIPDRGIHAGIGI